MEQQIDDSRDVFYAKNRKVPSSSDDLHVYKAVIYKNLGPNDDRLQVRIIPNMLNIKNEELDFLPRYPAFIKGQMITGYTEYDKGIKEASRVYVLATSDFTVGYILGLANEFEGNTEAKFKESIHWRKIKSFLSQRSIKPDDFEYCDIQIVTRTSEKDSGGLLILYNFRTGDYFIINQSGTFLTIQSNRIVMRVGSPGSPGEDVNFSQIKMTGERIEIITPTLDITSPEVFLGHSGAYVAATNAPEGVAVGVDGVTFGSITTIHV